MEFVSNFLVLDLFFFQYLNELLFPLLF
ncbi:hypothetical protein FHS86_003884, partial [Roseimarinus sediminis]